LELGGPGVEAGPEGRGVLAGQDGGPGAEAVLQGVEPGSLLAGCGLRSVRLERVLPIGLGAAGRGSGVGISVGAAGRRVGVGHGRWPLHGMRIGSRLPRHRGIGTSAARMWWISLTSPSLVFIIG